VFPVWESVNGQCELSTPSKLIALAPQKKKPVVDYLQGQGRFRHMFKLQGKKLLEEVQRITDERWQRLLTKCGMAQKP
jgi:pyruvate ferredoxin oxidoreductase beta subunit